MADEVGVELPLSLDDPEVNPDAKNRNWNKLPLNPENMTYHGRYDALDRFTLALIDVESLSSERQVSVLDFAGGVLQFGSPTGEDLFNKIHSSGHNASFVIVDKKIPKNLKPHVAEIQYEKELNNIVGQNQFDIVRALHVVDHLEGEEYESIRSELVGRVREGGLFVVTQQYEYEKRDSYGDVDSRQLPNIIKIMQKRNGQMVPIALLPDSRVPHPSDMSSVGSFFLDDEKSYKKKYREYRQNAAKGDEKIPRGELDEIGFDITMSWLENSDMKTLQHESLYGLRRNGLIRLRGYDKVDNQDLSEKLIQNAKDTSKYFRGENIA